ncbi:MAG: hypothetical protein BMS9Abin29_1937 [Gemmatimonadota bacterium]|nr:MAG: hypothetical protein BMS9Abin29_1937 [Gemmatimonadota bacterium]
MHRRTLPLALAFVSLVVASCTDLPTSEVDDTEIPRGLLEPSLDLVDGNNGEGGNPYFFWLKPLTKAKKFSGEADPMLFPVVEICLRNQTEDGCDEGVPLLASFERSPDISHGGDDDDDDDDNENNIEVDGKGHYSVHWRMEDFPPQLNAVYRIRVVIQGSELGHVDVVAVKKKDSKSHESDKNDKGDEGEEGDEVAGPNPDGDVIQISNKGSFKIAFRIEEGALEEQFCNVPEACAAAVEIAGDGQPTVIAVTTGAPGQTQTVTVVTVSDAVFEDAQGNPIDNVLITAEMNIGPPSVDLFTDNNQELPFFVGINTFPENVFIDPAGPGVKVVVCQDDAELTSRGIVNSLHPQLIMYKVTDPKPGFPDGETKRVPSTFGAPECSGFVPPAPSGARAPGLAALLRWGASKVLGLVKPTPVRAYYYLHGGLNTTVTRGTESLDLAFSTFAATLGPNAAHTTATVPDGVVNQTTNILIQVKNGLDENFLLGGDVLDVTIIAGPNAGAPVTVVDQNNGMYTATYVPVGQGTDEIQILLTTADGVALGPIGGSPFTSVVLGLGATIDAVALSSTTLAIGGSAVSYTATMTNNTASTLATVVLQGWMDQGSASRAAGGVQVLCGSGAGNLPPGTCTFSWTAGASNSGGGSGTLVPGPATARFELKDDGTVVSTFTVPVTLIALGAWTTTGSMGAARRDHRAVELIDGRVLVVGGGFPEIWDPSTGNFSSLGTTVWYNPGTSATLLPDGKVLIAGAGLAELFDPSNDTFTATTGAPPQARTHHSATLLGNGKVLIAGGQLSSGPQSLGSAELYDPLSGTFSTIASSLVEDRTGHSATLLPNGEVLLAGGTQTTTPGFGICLNEAEVYDPVSNSFTVTSGTMTDQRCSLWWPGAPLLSNGMVLFASGAGTNAELYDPNTGSFAPTGSMSVSRGSPTLTLLSDGRVLVAGGHTAIGPITTASAEIYDPVTGVFTPVASMNDGRQQHTATLLTDGRVLVIGGYSSTLVGDLSSAELYIP